MPGMRALAGSRGSRDTELNHREKRMLKPKILKLAAAVTIASAAGLASLGAAAASAAPVLPGATAASSATSGIVNGAMENEGSSLFVQTQGHNNPVQISSTGKSFLSQVDCTTFDIPRFGLREVCLLENESGLCLNAATTTTEPANALATVFADSCVPGDPNEEWWVTPDSDGSANSVYVINAAFSNSTERAFMTEEGKASGSDIGLFGPGFGAAGQWQYPA